MNKKIFYMVIFLFCSQLVGNVFTHMPALGALKDAVLTKKSAMYLTAGATLAVATSLVSSIYKYKKWENAKILQVSELKAAQELYDKKNEEYKKSCLLLGLELIKQVEKNNDYKKAHPRTLDKEMPALDCPKIIDAWQEEASNSDNKMSEVLKRHCEGLKEAWNDPKGISKSELYGMVNSIIQSSYYKLLSANNSYLHARVGCLGEEVAQKQKLLKVAGKVPHLSTGWIVGHILFLTGQLKLLMVLNKA